MHNTPSGLINVSVTEVCELSKVRSFEKQQELFNILHSEDAAHYERLYLAGFLKHVGYSLDEICQIIDAECSWGDYDAKTTYCQVLSIFRREYPHISSPRSTEGGHAPPEVLHNELQASILKEWELYHKKGCLEYEVSDRGDGRRGFVDVVLFDNGLSIGVEIDRASPKLKSITKMRYFDIAVFILRSGRITLEKRQLIDQKLSLFDKPFMLVLLSDGVIINRIPDKYTHISIFFRNWFASSRGGK